MPSFRKLIDVLLDDGRLYDVLRAQHRRWERTVEFGDFVQEAMLRCWSRRETFHGEEIDDLLVWVRRVSNSVLIDLVRRQKARRRGGEAVRLPLEAEGIDAGHIHDPSYQVEINDELEHALCGLAQHERLVVINHYIGGYSFREIAELMTWPYHKVTRLHGEALRKMRGMRQES